MKSMAAGRRYNGGNPWRAARNINGNRASRASRRGDPWSNIYTCIVKFPYTVVTLYTLYTVVFERTPVKVTVTRLKDQGLNVNSFWINTFGYAF